MAPFAALHLRWKSLIRAFCGCFCLLLATTSYAQPVRPPAPTKPAPSQEEPTQAAEAGQLSPLKMEEALRLLLRADSVASQRQRARLGSESSGLVVDQTITKIGHDFYDQFYSRWEAPANVTDFIIVIGEKPGRGNNAIVTLSVNDTDLLEFPLQSKYDLIMDTAQHAIEIAGGYLQQAYNVSQQLEKGNKQPLEVY